MKIFKWMQNRFNGTNEKMKSSSISTTHYMMSDSDRQDLINDWDEALVLAIGTFGNINNNLKEDYNKNIDEEDSYNSFQDCTKELCFEEDGNFENGVKINLEENNFCPSNNLIYNRGSRECLDKSKNGVSKKSLSFLLKKMFVCGNGLPPTTPLCKDLLSTDSRMEKILKAILHKKIHPQDLCSTTFVKKYLVNNSMKKIR
ncbi:protein NEGATIVE GRAVITROPIC RESPONSE OF ROOTS-like [Vicia villosa]|uniref:protein NEGATIVE GRAVITROPIC RESPONSE OF ROOTS-like n=1 Tax=Vicia villosa TaxID=3911 RepID=UPI00273C729C|nr:protein NEGATIVE GRAVITROPIC RESPONSE OF ROOTS-like [Vicia villosa]